jgi:DNA polymerase
VIVSIDFETRSAVDLRKTGVYVYADDDSTDIWCMAYAFDDEEPKLWTPADPIDVRLEDYIVEGGKLRAWNASFERVIWNKVMVERYKWPRTTSKQWHCTMAQASAMGLPRALGQAAAVLGVDEQKDKTGQALMLRMARPRKTNDDGTHTWWNTADKMEALFAYCLQDVRTEVSIAERLIEMDQAERDIYLLDQRINDRGVLLDRDLLRHVRVLADNSKEEIDAEMRRLTRGEVPGATKGVHLVKWLNSKGVMTKSVDKQHVAKMLTLDLHPVIKKVLELRQDGAKSSTAKLDSMENAAGSDDRMRGLLVYHGAATGRWSGKLVQPQNFPRPSRDQDEIDEIIAKSKARQSVKDHGAGTHIASDLLRSMLIAKPGHRLLFADYAAIEARVLAWLAGEKELVKTFAEGGDVYKVMAKDIYNKPVEEIDSGERQVGKMAILGCGYGMGGKRFAEQCSAMGIDVDGEEAKRIVSVYRESNSKISGYWRKIEQEFLENCEEEISQSGEFARLKLKSGRSLTYHNPRIVERDSPWGPRETVEVDTLNSMTRQWSSQFIWGGLLTENVVQATARDLMAGAMMRLELSGYPVIMSVHDEIICEVPEGHGSLYEMIEIMTTVPDWAAGCPIAAEGKESDRYEK